MDEYVTQVLNKFREGQVSRQELLQVLFEFIIENPKEQQGIIGLLSNEGDKDLVHIADGILELIGARSRK